MLSIDSELMTNYVSTVPVPAGSHHVAVLDEKRMPLLFARSNDVDQPRLSVLRRDSQGRSAHFDIHKLIGLPDDAFVQAFHVEQSWSLKIYLAVAYRASENTSTMLLLKPFTPEQLQEGVDTVLPKILAHRPLGSTEKIYMSPISGTNSEIKYPDVFVVHKNLSQISSWGSDITHLHVDAKFQRWIATDEMNTPQNVSEILNVAPAVSPYGQGLYVLYVTQGMTKLFVRFMRPDPHATDGTMFSFVTDVQCPPGARCIASFLNEKGFTCLLIASNQGIHYLNVADSTSKDRPGKLAFTASMFKNIRQLYVAQDHGELTIWFRNSQNELGYTRTMSEDVEGAAVSSMLLPAGSSSAFAPLVSSRDELTGHAVRQMVISNDLNGKLMLLEQSDDVGLWRKTPFYAPSKTTPSELKSYTVTIKASDPTGSALANGSIQISASSSLSIILNGQNLLLTKVPSWYDCDSTGSLDLIIPSDSLGSQALRFEQLRTQEGEILKNFKEVNYDPATKPMELFATKLGAVHGDEEAFKALKTSTGEELFSSDVRADSETMAAAQKQLGLVSQAYAKAAAGPQETMLSVTSSTTMVVAAARGASDGFGDLLMDGWYWVREKFEEVTEWFIDTANSVWKFVCKIAGEFKEFVLDCVEKICEAATWIWEKVKVGWQKLVDFIGFIFNWDDILATKNTISSTIFGGFEFAGLEINDVAHKVDEFFDDLEKTIDKFGDTISSDKQISDESKNSKNDKVNDAQKSTSGTWAQERLKNGGAGTNTKADLQGAKPDNNAANFWDNHIVPEVTKLGEQLSKVGTDITNLFKKDGSVSMNDVLTIGKDVLKAGLTAVRGIVKDLLGLVKGLITLLAEVGAAKIEIPIFSWLYKQISKGHPLTLVDAISLIVAIPTTIFAKLITGKAPPKFKSMNGTLLKGLYGEGEVDDQTKADWAIFKAEVAVGITLTSGVIGVIKLLYKMATTGLDEVLDSLDEGPSSLFDIFGIVVDMIGCLIALPDSAELPGATYRAFMGSISFWRGAYHILAFFISKKNPVFESTVYCLDLLTVLANLGLSIAVGIAEHQTGKKWKDYDENATNTGFITAGLNAVAGIAYFAAFMFKTTNPDVSAVGASVMAGTMAGTSVLQGLQFKLQYDDLKNPTLSSAPAF